MKKAKVMKLVEALRSGEYKKGTGRLVDGSDRFCCLGVACNISTSSLEWKKSHLSGWGMDGREGILPKSIKKEYGFYSLEGDRRDGKELLIGDLYYENLAHANDMGCTFRQIADYIEEHYKQL